MERNVTVVIANWNGRELLPHCLTSLRAQTLPPHEIIVVDNGSTDDSVGYLQQTWPEVILVRNSSNVGFGEANNIGIRRASGEYVATLNNDAWAEPGWLEAMVAAAPQGEQVGMVASTMLFANRPEIIASAGIDLYWNGLATDRLLGAQRSSLIDQRPTEVFGPSAGAALYAKAMLREVGLFDAAYFAYLEDVDLAWRARLKGWRCLHTPGAVVYHVYSGTGGQESAFKNYHLARNRLWTIIVDMPAGTLRRNLAHILLYEAFAIAYGLGRRDRGLLMGRLAALRSLPKLLEKRRQVQKSRIVADREIERFIKPTRNPLDAYRQRRHLRTILSTSSAEY